VTLQLWRTLAGWAAAVGSLSRLHQTVLGWHVVSTSNPTAAFSALYLVYYVNKLDLHVLNFVIMLNCEREIWLGIKIGRKNCFQEYRFQKERSSCIWSLVFWDVALRRHVEVDWRFRGAYCLHHEVIHRSVHHWNVCPLQHVCTALNFILTAVRSWNLASCIRVVLF
jgi:hypothetical protein